VTFGSGIDRGTSLGIFGTASIKEVLLASRRVPGVQANLSRRFSFRVATLFTGRAAITAQAVTHPAPRTKSFFYKAAVTFKFH
jgi:hypothetical protein